MSTTNALKQRLAVAKCKDHSSRQGIGKNRFAPIATAKHQHLQIIGKLESYESNNIWKNEPTLKRKLNKT